MAKKSIAQKTTGKEAIYGGFEHRISYDKYLKKQRGSKRGEKINLLLRIFLCILLIGCFVSGTFFCINLFKYLAEQKDQNRDADEISDRSIQHSVAIYQTSFGFEEVNEEEAEIYKIPKGLRIKSISPESNEYNAGIREGDIIVGFNGVDVTNTDCLYELINKCSNNDKVRYKIFRSNEYFECSLNLLKR